MVHFIPVGVEGRTEQVLGTFPLQPLGSSDLDPCFQGRKMGPWPSGRLSHSAVAQHSGFLFNSLFLSLTRLNLFY